MPLLRLLDPGGTPIDAAREWAPLWVEVGIPPEDWEAAELWRGTEILPLAVRRVGWAVRVVAEWPRSGTGNYELRLLWRSGVFRLPLTVHPEKLSPASYAQLLEDLETRLPASVALGLQRLGGLSGLELLPPGESTLAEEVHRLRRAIVGTSERRGLAELLPEIARDPHSILASRELWVRRGSARRPHPARLAHALSRANNVAVDKKPLRVVDARVEHTVDVYENRLLKAFTGQVERRLHRVRCLSLASAVQDELADLDQRLEIGKRQAGFLADVRELDHAPNRVSMVLLKRPSYRAALEGYLDFHRRVAVRLDTEALDSPLENLPHLYQVWGTLTVIDVLLSVGLEYGYQLKQERLVAREGGGVFLRILPDGKTVMKLIHPDTGSEVKLIPERSYPAGAGPGLRSITYTQRPDVAVEVGDPGDKPRVILFDPKYKLDGEMLEAGGGDGKPKKVDIDKMHAYRDAIRDRDGERVVEYAAILYPGPEQIFPEGIEALSARPGAIEYPLRDRLESTLSQALSSVAARKNHGND
jgi:hypothetical protein